MKWAFVPIFDNNMDTLIKFVDPIYQEQVRVVGVHDWVISGQPWNDVWLYKYYISSKTKNEFMNRLTYYTDGPVVRIINEHSPKSLRFVNDETVEIF